VNFILQELEKEKRIEEERKVESVVPMYILDEYIQLCESNCRKFRRLEQAEQTAVRWDWMKHVNQLRQTISAFGRRT
jgi:hypothetical protein